LAARIWVEVFFKGIVPRLWAFGNGQARDDRDLTKRTAKVRHAEIIWDPVAEPSAPVVVAPKTVTPPTENPGKRPLHAAE
jgi:multidrug efflux pump